MRSMNVYLACLMNSVIRWAGKSFGRVVIYSSVAHIESVIAIYNLLFCHFALSGMQNVIQDRGAVIEVGRFT